MRGTETIGRMRCLKAEKELQECHEDLLEELCGGTPTGAGGLAMEIRKAQLRRNAVTSDTCRSHQVRDTQVVLTQHRVNNNNV